MRRSPERREELERTIRETFAQERAVLILDICGFSRLTLEYGIVPILLLIRRLRARLIPCVAARGGEIAKEQGDTFYCLFETVDAAVEAALEIQRAAADERARRPEEPPLEVAIGIGFGEILNAGGRDLFGSEVNLASKLGEDLGGPGDILLTAAAYTRLRPGDRAAHCEVVPISGLDLTCYTLHREADAPGAGSAEPPA